MTTTTKLDSSPKGMLMDVSSYRGMIASLFYLTGSRQNIIFSTYLCAKFQADPLEFHLIAVKRIFRYLKETPSIGLWYPRDSDFSVIGYSLGI